MPDNEHPSHRRSVLKGAVWAAPAIVVATAAPAVAASPARLEVTSPSASRGGTVLGRTITVGANIRNLAADDTTNFTLVVQVTLTSAGQWETLLPLTPASATAAGFNAAVVSGSGVVRNFTLVSQTQLSFNSPRAVSVVITTGSGQSPSGTIVIEAQPAGVGGASGNGSATVIL